MTLDKTTRYTAQGKFLLTGEYVVLDGVRALATPLKLGQTLEITARDDHRVEWLSQDVNGQAWFRMSTDINELLDQNHFYQDPIAQRLATLIRTAKKDPNSKLPTKGFTAIIQLAFDQTYGLGSSSTLVSLLAQWLHCNPYTLQFKVFGGSGYDIACAKSPSPIIYQLHDKQPIVEALPPFTGDFAHLFFVHLNQKQNSRESIALYDPQRLHTKDKDRLNEMPEEFVAHLSKANKISTLMEEHEQIISSLVQLTTVKERLFTDYPHGMKSLGGWGGDFIMVVGQQDADRDYFRRKGYTTIFEWDELV